MIPLRDLHPTRIRPVVTWIIVALNALVFVVTFSDLDAAARTLGAVPFHFTGHDAPPPIAIPETGDVFYPVPDDGTWPLRIVTHMFTHGGLLHILGNMWFLWIFGDNVEERLGHLRYALLYFAGGLLALAAQIVADPGSGVPMVGASGAVAAALGAYLRLFPHARILALVPLGFIFLTVVWPAGVFLGLWIGFQVLRAITSIGVDAAGGVAWWAHIGGFAFGFAAAGFLQKRPPRIEVEFGAPRRRGRQRDRF